MLRDCIICETYKNKNDMDYHVCPYIGKDSMFNFKEND